jgi:predicted transposase YdaD
VPPHSIVLEEPPPYIPNHTTRHLHDSGYKLLLSNKATFLQFVRRFVPGPLVDDIDDVEMLSVNPEFVKSDLFKMTGDLIYRVRSRSRQTYYFILLEHQSTINSQMGVRFFKQMMEQWRRTIQERSATDSPADTCELPMILPIVLYNGKSPWNRLQTVILNIYQVGSPLPLPVELQYALIDVHRLSPEALSTAADIMSNAFYLDQTIDTDPNETIRRLQHIIQPMASFTDNQYKPFIEWLNAMLRARIGTHRDEINEIFQQTKRGEEATMIEKVQNAWQKQIEEVRLAGIQQGKQEGKQEGLLEGKKELALQLLRSGLVDIAAIAKVTAISEDEIRSWMQ